MSRAHAAFRLARWLGPWTGEKAVPLRVRRREMTVPAQADALPFPAWIYTPEGPIHGALLLVQGLHYAGPADPRLDRFCRILADAGILVFAPFLPDFARMRVEPTLVRDAERAFDVLLSLPERPAHVRPGVFSISFGSLPAIALASKRPEVGGLMLFGGYADFRETIRFSLLGSPGRAHDPLNQCVVFMNLLEHLPTKDPASLQQAWMHYVKSTWGRPHMKPRAAFEPLARQIASSLGDENRELFLVGTGVLPGGKALLDETLPHKDVAHLDPLPFARVVACPTIVSHGRDDDVIPFEHAEKLQTAIPGASCFLTGMYAHTGHSGLASLLGQLPRELRAMVGIVQGMASTAGAR
ncbi:MAG: hypothetical protein AAGE52_24980 [Myxococcota bacterium]